MKDFDEDLKLIQESIAHYERMIQWAETQNPTDKVLEGVMFGAIYENWHSNYCSLCEKYNLCSPVEYDFCFDNERKPCPLSVDNSNDWGEWLKNAAKMLQQLQSLIKE